MCLPLFDGVCWQSEGMEGSKRVQSRKEPPPDLIKWHHYNYNDKKITIGSASLSKVGCLCRSPQSATGCSR